MQIIEVEEFLSTAINFPIVDVRAPQEFLEGHIPGAINMPLFSDEERARVGTTYKKVGKIEAVDLGLEFVGPKMAIFAKKARSIAVNNTIMIHCWRGGMRSQSMAWLFEQVGIKCYLLDGGYKSYRQFLLDKMGELNTIVVLSGNTGAGKTDLINEMQRLQDQQPQNSQPQNSQSQDQQPQDQPQDQQPQTKQPQIQAIDLEGLANHRGSVFGGIDQPQQPSTQQFQNILFQEVLKCDMSKPIWVEGESKAIGRVFIPDPFWSAMKSAPVIEVAVSDQSRVDRLVRDYGKLSQEGMLYAIGALKKRLGDMVTREIEECYLSGDMPKVAELLLSYYDKAYSHGRNTERKNHFTLDLGDDGVVESVQKIIAFFNNLTLED